LTALRERLWPLLARLLRDHLRSIADPAGALLAGNVEALHTVLGPHVEGGDRVTAELAFLWSQGELYVDSGVVHVRTSAKRTRSAAAERKARQRERDRLRQLELLDKPPPEGVTLGVTPPVTDGRDIDSVTGRDIPPASPPPSALPLSPSPTLAAADAHAGVGANEGGESLPEGVTPSVTVTVTQCPRDLRLTDDQFTSLQMNIGIDRESADALTAKFVAKMVLEEPRPLRVWLKCLSSAISGDWNAGVRPLRQRLQGRGAPSHRQPDSGYDPFAAAEASAEDVTRVTGS
jgi:hypothetical protein